MRHAKPLAIRNKIDLADPSQIPEKAAWYIR